MNKRSEAVTDTERDRSPVAAARTAPGRLKFPAPSWMRGRCERRPPARQNFRATRRPFFWSAVTCHRFCAGDLSPSPFRAHPLTHARTPTLARAVSAPFCTHASRTSTATCRLGKAVTSHRTGVWTFSFGRDPRGTAGARPVPGRSACAPTRVARKFPGTLASSLPLRAGTARAPQKRSKTQSGDQSPHSKADPHPCSSTAKKISS